MVSTSTRIAGGQESVLRCRQVVAIENGGQCFRIAVYDWGATASMVTREAVNTRGLPSFKANHKGDQGPKRHDGPIKDCICSSPCG
jgi:hypothetical protein